MFAAFFIFISSANCLANEIEKKFVAAGLIDVHVIDNSIKVDLVNSDYWGYAKQKMFDLSESQKQNRKLLSNIMKKAGFIPLSYEWWHFNGMPKDEARKKYKIIE